MLRVASKVKVHAEAQCGPEGVHLGIDVGGGGGDEDPQSFGLQLVGEQDRFLPDAVLLSAPERAPRTVVLQRSAAGREESSASVSWSKTGWPSALAAPQAVHTWNGFSRTRWPAKSSRFGAS